MADFVLVVPRFRRRKDRTAQPPFVFLKLAAVLEREGFTSELIDARIETDYMNKIKTALKRGPLYMGITSMTGFQTLEGLRIAGFIKKSNPDVPVVWGGVHASLLPDQVLENSCVDIAVMGEGERPVVSLAGMFKTKTGSLDDIEGIAFRRQGQIIKNPRSDFLKLDSLPMPAWHLVKDRIGYYTRDDGKGINIITSTGCPHDCYFCYNMSYNRSKFRARSAENVINEIEFLNRNYGVKKIGFSDDNFIVDRARVFRICEGLRQKKLNMEMQCDIRADYINEELMSCLCGSGFKRFLFGVESGSQKILDLVNKKTTVERIKDAISTVNRHTDGGHIYSMITGLPYETKEDIEKTWELAKWIYGVDRKAQIALNVYTPYPGVRLTGMLEKDGYSIPKTDSEWARYGLLSIEDKNWIREKRLIRSLVNIFRLAFPGNRSKIIRFFSGYARKRFLSDKLKAYPEFELSYYIFNKLW